MRYLTIIIALGIVVFFGYWSGNRRLKSERRQKSKIARSYPLSKPERQTQLRRVK